MLLVKSCCSGCSLRTGTLMILFFSVIISIPFSTIAAYFPYALVVIICSGFGIYAVLKEKPLFLIPYLVILAISAICVLYFVYFLFNLFFVIYEQKASSIELIFFEMVVLVKIILFYYVVCVIVLSYYVELKRLIQQRTDPSMGFLIIVNN